MRIIIEYIMIASLVINPRTGKINAERKNGRNEVFKAYDIVLGIENDDVRAKLDIFSFDFIHNVSLDDKIE